MHFRGYFRELNQRLPLPFVPPQRGNMNAVAAHWTETAIRNLAYGGCYLVAAGPEVMVRILSRLYDGKEAQKPSPR